MLQRSKLITREYMYFTLCLKFGGCCNNGSLQPAQHGTHLHCDTVSLSLLWCLLYQALH